MKKLFLISLIALTVFTNPIASSAQAFKEGDKILAVGLGFGSSIIGYSYTSQSPAFSVQFESANWSVGGPGVISLGGYLGYKSVTYDYAPYAYYNFSDSWTYTLIGLRSAYHYNGLNTMDWDVYGGAMLSYNIVSYKHTSNDPRYDYLYTNSASSGLWLSLYIGGRYYVSDRVALFAELGYGISNFTLGAALKL